MTFYLYLRKNYHEKNRSILLVCASMAAFYQPIKSKALKLKYTLSNNLKANEFTDSLNLDKGVNDM